jgi:hypothetical protein
VHAAGFERHKEFAAIQPVIAQCLRCRPQRDDFCMGSRVVASYWLVAANGNHLAVFDDYCADRHFAL